MKFTPYSSKDFSKVLHMLEQHIDFAPDLASPVPDENLSMFEDPGHNIQSYILKSDDAAYVFAYMQVSKGKRDLKNGEPCFYVTELYAKNDGHAEEHAKALLTEFENVLITTSELCGNVCPGNEYASAFWEANGYHLSPERSVFYNVEHELLAAYRKCLIQ